MPKVPSKPFLVASQALWKGRHTYRNREVKKWVARRTGRERLHRFYHDDSKRPDAERRKLASKWHKNVEEADAEVKKWVGLRAEASKNLDLRRRQLKSYAPKRSTRGTAVSWAKAQAGTTESPPGSNRGGKITDWQRALGAWLVGTPWCGSFVAAAMRRAGVKRVNYRLASVAYIEDDAQTRGGPFRGWTTSASGALPGDLVVLFGRGTHVGMVVSVHSGYVRTVEGNTSGASGRSQSNGGGVFLRSRPLSQCRGFALVRYPG
jgi:hypothetical protein